MIKDESVRKYRLANPDAYKATKEKTTARRRERYNTDPDHHAEVRARNQKYRDDNRDKVRESNRRSEALRKPQAKGRMLKWCFGIGVDEFNSILSCQGGKCAICGDFLDSSTKSLTPHVDHDHKTSKIRGILCGHCNFALGHAKDDPNRLVAMATYLWCSQTQE